MSSSSQTTRIAKMEIFHGIPLTEARREKRTVDLTNALEQLRNVKARRLNEKAQQKPPVTAAAEPRSSSTSSPPTSSTRVGNIYQVVVSGIRGEKVVVGLCNTEEQMRSMTVGQLKEKIALKLPHTAGQQNLRLIFTDKALDEDSNTLSHYGIQQRSVIHIVLKVPGGLIA